MVKGTGAQNLPADVTQLIDQLERHCLAPDGSLVSKPTFFGLQLAREEMCKERQRHLEALTIYLEAISMVEEYQQGISLSSLHNQLGLKNPPQVYETLEHRMIVAEAAQKLRLPSISKDGEIHEEEIEKWSAVSRSSVDSTGTSATLTSTSNSTSYTNVSAIGTGAASTHFLPGCVTDSSDPEVGGVPNGYLGITPAYLWQKHTQPFPLSMDLAECQMCLAREIAGRLETKCDRLTDAIVAGDIDLPTANIHNSTARLPERMKLIIEEIEREESAWREDLYSSDRKFSEYYNVLEQILGVLIKLVKEIKLPHQHKYDELHKTWLCKRCETMKAKLRTLEHVLLLDSYTTDTIPALHKIRKYLAESTEEASLAYNKAVTRLSEYQGVDPHFDSIARQYQDITKKLEILRWTIHQVEIDLNRMPGASGCWRHNKEKETGMKVVGSTLYMYALSSYTCYPLLQMPS